MNSLVHLFEKERKTSIIATIALLLLIMSTISAFVANAKVHAFQVKVNDTVVAEVKDKTEAETVIQQLVKERNKKYGEQLPAQVTYEPVRVSKEELDTVDKLKQEAGKLLNSQTTGYGIKINEKVEVVLASEAKAKQVIEVVKSSYSNGENVDVKFNEDIKIESIKTNPSNLLEVQSAAKLLQDGRVKTEAHKVQQGENLWVIAKDYNISVDKLIEANSEINPEKLDIDQEIFIVRPEPLLNGEATINKTVEEEIPYKTVVERDRNLERGKQKTKQEGSKGKKEATYTITYVNGKEQAKELVAEKILAKPVDKVVVKGSKDMVFVASRGSGGMFAWPHRGKITSKFGSRWGRMHEGIDIDGRTGDLVGAAAEGRVVHAGWKGAYGKLVIIDHGNGYQTYYAHLSQISVKSGERVEKGQLIGKLGNTGRSTGSHLHFEIRKNGIPKNPLSYL